MCGILAYQSWSMKDSTNVYTFMITLLKLLEYRGYDSTGVAISIDEQTIQRYREVGNVDELAKILPNEYQYMCDYQIAMGHTRWATHGQVSVNNCHPHKAESIYVVHNGTIDNYIELANELAMTSKLTSHTDTEVLAYWLYKHAFQEQLALAECCAKIQKCLVKVQGNFSMVLLDDTQPRRLIALRRGSPLILGKNSQNIYISSDMNALLKVCSNIYHIPNNSLIISDVSTETPQLYVYDLIQSELHVPKFIEITSIPFQRLTTDLAEDFPHYMIKEIHDQINSVTKLLTELPPITKPSLTDNIVITGCGSAYLAGLTAKYILEQYIDRPIQVELASELLYRKYHIPNNTWLIVLSQSGETIDTLTVIEYFRQLSKTRNIHITGLINVLNSTMTQVVDDYYYLHAGPEYSVASTKAFTNQIIALIELFTQTLIPKNSITTTTISPVLSKVWSQRSVIITLAEKFFQLPHNSFFYLGRREMYPIALEGALKMKEVAYIHAEALSATEMKHGPIALIDDVIVIFLLPANDIYDKTYINLQQILARKHDSSVIVITDKPNFHHSQAHTINVGELQTTIERCLAFNMILQLLSYYYACLLKRPIDQPRNLAKSVTVE